MAYVLIEEQKSSGKHVQLQPASLTVLIFTIGDVRANARIFVQEILKQPKLTHYKFALAYVELMMMGQLLEIWTAATEKPSVYVQTSLEDFDHVWLMWGHEISIMQKFWEKYKEKSWSGEDILVKEDLGIKEGLVGSKEMFSCID